MNGQRRKGNSGGNCGAAAVTMVATVGGDGNDSVSNNQQQDKCGITARDNRRTTDI